MTATSARHKTASSKAFLNNPFFRLRNVTYHMSVPSFGWGLKIPLCYDHPWWDGFWSSSSPWLVTQQEIIAWRWMGRERRILNVGQKGTTQVQGCVLFKRGWWPGKDGKGVPSDAIIKRRAISLVCIEGKFNIYPREIRYVFLFQEEAEEYFRILPFVCAWWSISSVFYNSEWGCSFNKEGSRAQFVAGDGFTSRRSKKSWKRTFELRRLFGCPLWNSPRRVFSSEGGAVSYYYNTRTQ